MQTLGHKRSEKTGLPPGTLIHVGPPRSEEVFINIIDYNETSIHEKRAATLEDCVACRDTTTISWINVDGVHRPDIVEKIGAHFGIHPLVLEDILNTNQRPKYEDYETYLYIVLKMLYYAPEDGELIAEQVSLVLGPSWVISFQEAEGDVFDPIRDRLRTARGRLRRQSADFLAYALMDAVVDNYFIVLERTGDTLDDLEEEIIKETSPQFIQNIHALKRDTLYMRKAIWPLREVASGLEREDSPLVSNSTRIFLRDVYDHTIQVMDTLDMQRDLIAGMLDIYLSSMNNRLNEVMKTLTMFSVIFIPLTFIAGLYGMNFEHMPELAIPWAYPLLLVIMATVVITMLVIFKIRKWL